MFETAFTKVANKWENIPFVLDEPPNGSRWMCRGTPIDLNFSTHPTFPSIALRAASPRVSRET
jgi:hypothetical protein